MFTAHCSIIPLEELQALIRAGVNDLPVWVEVNPNRLPDWRAGATTIEAAAIQDYGNGSDRVITGCDDFPLKTYGKDWRLWYACGVERPGFDMPW